MKNWASSQRWAPWGGQVRDDVSACPGALVTKGLQGERCVVVVVGTLASTRRGAQWWVGVVDGRQGCRRGRTGVA